MAGSVEALAGIWAATGSPRPTTGDMGTGLSGGNGGCLGRGGGTELPNKPLIFEAATHSVMPSLQTRSEGPNLPLATKFRNAFGSCGPDRTPPTEMYQLFTMTSED